MLSFLSFCFLSHLSVVCSFLRHLLKSSCLSYLHALLDAIRFCFSKVFSSHVVRCVSPRPSVRLSDPSFAPFGWTALSWPPFGSVIYVAVHLEQATVEAIMRDKMPRKGGRWWFSWRGRNTTSKEVSTAPGVPGAAQRGWEFLRVFLRSRGRAARPGFRSRRLTPSGEAGGEGLGQRGRRAESWDQRPWPNHTLKKMFC